jgi:hypothetical protein
MASDTDNRLQSLEENNRKLAAKVAELESKLAPKPTTAAPAPKSQDEEGIVRTLFPLTTAIEMPTPAQFNKLFAIAESTRPKRVPEFTSAWERSEYIRRCGLAFQHLTNIRRSETPNEGYAFSWWTDNANAWLRQQGSSSIEGDHLFVALLMIGDVPYQLPNAQLGKVLTIGLTFNTDCKVASSQGWKSVLERGTPRPQFMPVVQREHRTVVRVVR